MNLARLASDARSRDPIEVRVLSSWPERLRGLLGSGEDARAVLITRCGSIHTFGMRYPLDVAFLSEVGVVLAVFRDVAPGEFRSHPEAWCAIERPSREGAWLEKDEQLWIVSVSVGMAG